MNSSAESVSSITFSVCIPCYNGRKYLRETLESVRAQSHTNWELIVVEDASPEPSRDIVEDFASSVTQRVIYHANPTNLKTPHTRDQAHALASHDYIAPLDYDDLWKPNHLADFADYFAKNEVDFIFTGCTCFRDDIKNADVHFVPAETMLNQLNLAYRQCRFGMQPSSVAFTRRLLDRVGPWSKNIEFKRRDLPGFSEIGEDRNFFLNAIHAGTKLHWTGSITTYYRQSDHSQRAKGLAYVPVHRAWQDNYYGILPGYPIGSQRAYLSQSCANAGRTLKAERQHARLGALYYFRSWRWNPLKLHRLLQAGSALLTAAQHHMFTRKQSSQ